MVISVTSTLALGHGSTVHDSILLDTNGGGPLLHFKGAGEDSWPVLSFLRCTFQADDGFIPEWGPGGQAPIDLGGLVYIDNAAAPTLVDCLIEPAICRRATNITLGGAGPTSLPKGSKGTSIWQHILRGL